MGQLFGVILWRAPMDRLPGAESSWELLATGTMAREAGG